MLSLLNMKKLFFSGCTLSLISFGNGLTSFFMYKYTNCLHTYKVEEEIQNLLNHKIDPREVHILFMRIEAEDIPVQYLKGVTLEKCVLSGFNFDNVDLSQTNFINTQFKNCNLQKAIVWETSTYSEVLNLTKNQPQVLIKIYSDLIKKSNQYYLGDYYKQEEYYHKKANQFYRTLKTIKCSHGLKELKNRLKTAVLDTKPYYVSVRSKSFKVRLVGKLDAIIDEYEKTIF